MAKEKEIVPPYRVAEVVTQTEPGIVTEGDEPKTSLELLVEIANDLKELKGKLL